MLVPSPKEKPIVNPKVTTATKTANNEEDGKECVKTEPLKKTSEKVTPRKMFTCKVKGCGQSYNYSGGLRDHMRREHGAAKLPCRVPTCPATFTTHKSLGGHMKKEHGGARERWEVADASVGSTDVKSPEDDEEEEQEVAMLLSKRRREAEEKKKKKELENVQKQRREEREEEVEGDMSQ